MTKLLRFKSILVIILVNILLLTSCGDNKDINNNISSNESNISSQENSTVSIDSSEVDSNTESATNANANIATDSVKKFKGDSSDWRLVLANKDNALNENYEVQLGTIPEKYLVNASANRLDSRVVDPLLSMIEDAEKDGVKIRVTSAYRDISYQQMLFNRMIQQYQAEGYDSDAAKEAAAMLVAIPGTSEHNTGLAVDLVSADWYSYNSDLEESFEETDEYKWLEKNSVNYGFVIRYQKHKTDITKISYEPWHYRYVGIENAKIMTEHDLCLEEYLQK